LNKPARFGSQSETKFTGKTLVFVGLGIDESPALRVHWCRIVPHLQGLSGFDPRADIPKIFHFIQADFIDHEYEHGYSISQRAISE
jgi:hypothetical protein